MIILRNITTNKLSTSLSKRLLSKILQPSSVWSVVQQGPPDVILGITEAYKKDPFQQKINLGVGAYRDDNNTPFVLQSVKKAERLLLDLQLNKEYLGILGDLQFVELAKELAFDHTVVDLDNIASAQSISGTGALRLGGEFLKKYHAHPIYLPNPTWGNHAAIFKSSGLDVKSYKYYDKQHIKLDYQGMLSDINSMPDKATILLHACAHNPTGIDPAREQWGEICNLVKKKQLVAFFDMAYQGFASGDIKQDAYAVNHFVKNNADVLLAQSFAKNMGLYGERVGLFSVVTKNNQEKSKVESQLKIIIRPMYSNPPLSGARIAKTVLHRRELREEWAGEVLQMSSRIKRMRELLYKQLVDKKDNNQDWSHIKTQIGMFCYTGLNQQQVDRLITKHHVYLTSDGRISIAGITSNNVGYLADSISEVVNSC